MVTADDPLGFDYLNSVLAMEEGPEKDGIICHMCQEMDNFDDQNPRLCAYADTRIETRRFIASLRQGFNKE